MAAAVRMNVSFGAQRQSQKGRKRAHGLSKKIHAYEDHSWDHWRTLGATQVLIGSPQFEIATPSRTDKWSRGIAQCK
jgi:hypothetical protein